MWNLKNKINTQTKLEQIYRYGEHTVEYPRGGKLVGWMKKLKGLRSTDWQLQNSHKDIKYIIRTILNNTVITMYGARLVVEISGEQFVKYMTV